MAVLWTVYLTEKILIYVWKIEYALVYVSCSVLNKNFPLELRHNITEQVNNELIDTFEARNKESSLKCL